MFHIGVDIGGTFTDCVLVGDSTQGTATYSTAKTLSTKADPAEGVLAGLTELGTNVGLARPELLARTGRFGHGTTIGTNAVLERTGARVCVVAVPRTDQSLALGTLREWAGTQLADYKLPAELVILGALPRNASGKVIKKQLAEQLAAQLAGTRSPSAPART